MDRDAFREALLEVMERKDHWAWPGFTSGLVPAGRLHVHLEQEWEVYVRDFPVMVGGAYVQCPIPAAVGWLPPALACRAGAGWLGRSCW